MGEEAAIHNQSLSRSSLFVGKMRVLHHASMGKDTYRLGLECPRIAEMIVPGQFVMLRPTTGDDPLLGRPFALFDIVVDSQGKRVGIEIGYHVVGKFTRWMADRLHTLEEVYGWGPLGNGFSARPSKHLILVAGGIGQTPFLAAAREALGLRNYGMCGRVFSPLDRVTLCYGVRSAPYAAGLDDFLSLRKAAANQGREFEVRLSSDDGTLGHHGRVTELLTQVLRERKEQEMAGPEGVHIIACGPEPMMSAVAQVAASHAVPCDVSLETPMACGLGICFSCVAKIKASTAPTCQEWDYKRTCVEGPVFDAQNVVWG